MIVGLDTAANRLHAVLDNDAMWAVGPLTGKAWDSEPDTRRAELLRQARGFFESLEDGAHVFCEDNIALRNPKTNILLAKTTGAIWAAAQDFDLFWHWVPISAWKKEVVGNGNATKDDVKRHAELAGFYTPVEDYNDAFCIRQYGAKMLAKVGAFSQVE